MRRTRVNRSGSPVVCSLLWSPDVLPDLVGVEGSLSGMVVTVVGVVVLDCVVVVVVGSGGGGAGAAGCRAGAAAWSSS